MVKVEVIFTYNDTFDQDFYLFEFDPNIKEIDFLIELFKKIGKTKAIKLVKISTCQRVDKMSDPDIKFLIGFPRFGKYIFTGTNWGKSSDIDDLLKKSALALAFYN